MIVYSITVTKSRRSFKLIHVYQFTLTHQIACTHKVHSHTRTGLLERRLKWRGVEGGFELCLCDGDATLLDVSYDKSFFLSSEDLISAFRRLRYACF